MLEPHVQIAMREQGHVQDTITSVATETSQRVSFIARRTFPDMDDKTVIPSLVGIDPYMEGYAPTLSDVAARLPKYRDRLTTAQLDGLKEIYEEMREFDELFRRVGLKRPPRTDILRGGGRTFGSRGFYITRGSTVAGQYDRPTKVPHRG